MAVNTTLCKAAWCDQGDRPHERHEVTATTIIGEGWSRHQRQAVGVQFIIHGLEPEGYDAVPMLALVDPDGVQTDAVIRWDQAHALACSIITEHHRFSRPAE